MKRRYLLIFIIMIIMVLFTGCDKSSSKKTKDSVKVNDEYFSLNVNANYYDMVFYYDGRFNVSNYLDRIKLEYILNDGLDLYVEMSRSKCTDLEHCIDVFSKKYGNVSTMTIGGNDWARMVNDTGTTSIDLYFVQYKSTVYMIEIIDRGDVSDFENEFIRSIYFKEDVDTGNN